MDLLLDTNLLVRCVEPSHLLHLFATTAMKEISARADRAFNVPQVIYEYFVVCTRPISEYGGLGRTNESALAEIARVADLAKLLPDTRDVYPEWLRLIDEMKIAGKRGHDARLVAAMNVHGLRTILTFNAKDFTRYPGIQVLSPEELAASWNARTAKGTQA